MYAYTCVGMDTYVCIMERGAAAHDDQDGTGLGIGRISATSRPSCQTEEPEVEAVLRVMLGLGDCHALLQGCEG